MGEKACENTNNYNKNEIREAFIKQLQKFNKKKQGRISGNDQKYSKGATS